MLGNGNDNASTSSFAQNSLEELLTATDLLSYHDALKNVLKLRHAGDIGDTDSADLDGIGMSRPEQRRLMREYAKHYALEQRQQNGVVWKKFRLKVFGEAKLCKQRKVTGETDHWQGPGGEAETAQQPQHHIIPPERVTLCKKIGTGEFGHVFQAAWRDATGDGKKAIQVEWGRGGGVGQASRSQSAHSPKVAVKRILPEKHYLHSTASFSAGSGHNGRGCIIRMLSDCLGVLLETKAVMLVGVGLLFVVHWLNVRCPNSPRCGSLIECLQCPSWKRALFGRLSLSDFALQIIAQGIALPFPVTGFSTATSPLANVLVCTPSKGQNLRLWAQPLPGPMGEDYYRSEFRLRPLNCPSRGVRPNASIFWRFNSASDVCAYGVCPLVGKCFSYGKTPWAWMSVLTVEQRTRKAPWDLHSQIWQNKGGLAPGTLRFAFFPRFVTAKFSKILHSIPTTQRQKVALSRGVSPRRPILLMLHCWEWEAHLRPTFEQICDRLPSMVPPLLVTICESGTAKSGPSEFTEEMKPSHCFDKKKEARKGGGNKRAERATYGTRAYVGADGRSFWPFECQQKVTLARALPPESSTLPLSNDGQMRNTFPPAGWA
ncbi:hypothetical protein niasHT_005444 [Heterodera trifolii]|uniref:non-specific protein-tyrosine kinase n=1 Tax=Heterodera trifolii TaxID=157864 RepID=A0ABD2M6M4_9BILA